ncbi:MAG: hypothetical protein WCA07_01210 [Gloeobacterales cyanobacterium]
MEDLFSYRLSLLQKEMEMLQNGIRGYDSIVFTIKGWSITVFSAIILFAVDKQKPFLYLFCIASILSFWLIDAFYKSTQNILINRYRKIEIFLQGSDFETAMAERSFGSFLTPHFQEGFSMRRSQRLHWLLKAALQFHTYSLYALLLILAIGMFLFVR